jgi:Peptidase family M28
MLASSLALATGLVLAVYCARPPQGSTTSADGTAYHDGNALTHVEHIAERAHPLGSADHDRVRDYIIGQFRALGLDCEVQTGQGLDESSDGAQVFSSPVANVIATLHGRDASQPTLLVMSHYDSVSNSPAAADDGLGVATALEIARALAAGPQPVRDVVFLVSDGEEAGLLGAEYFFTQTTRSDHVGVVLNMEARGDAGRVHLFETGPGSAGLVDLYGSQARHPDANSFAAFVYHRMPNGTDMTHAINKGKPALNFAMIGDELSYHTALATAQHLDHTTLHHMGEQVFPVARALALAVALPKSGANEIYTDLLGRIFIHYSVTVGWVLLGVIAVLIVFALIRESANPGCRPAAWVRAAAAWLLLLLVSAQFLWAAGRLYSALEHPQRLPHLNTLLAGCVLCLVALLYLCLYASLHAPRSRILPAFSVGLTLFAQLYGLDSLALILGVLALLAWLLLRWRARDGLPLQLRNIWMAALSFSLLLFVFVQAFAAEATSVLVLQLAGAAIAATMVFVVGKGRASRPASIVIWLLAVVALAQSGMVAMFLFEALGMDLPIVLMLPWLAALPVLLPLLLEQRTNSQRRPAWAMVSLLAGVMAIAYARFAAPSALAPAATALIFAEDVDRREAYLMPDLESVDGYVMAALGTGAVHGVVPLLGESEYYYARAAPAAVAAPVVEAKRSGNLVTLRLTRPPGAQQLTLVLRSDQRLQPQRLNARRLSAGATPGARATYALLAPDETGLVLTLEVPAGAVALDVSARAWFDSWPAGAAALPRLPSGYVASGMHGYTLGVRRAKFTL